MSAIYTFTVEPTVQDIVWGLVDHAWAIAALVGLAGLLFGSKLLEEPP